MYEYKAIITNVIDGDTFDLDIDLGFHIHIHERVRLLGIDTPEKFGKEKQLGLAVTNWAKQQYTGKEIIITSEKAVATKTDSFGRWLVNVKFEDGTSILDTYNKLGFNKLNESYNIDKIKMLNN